MAEQLTQSSAAPAAAPTADADHTANAEAVRAMMLRLQGPLTPPDLPAPRATPPAAGGAGGAGGAGAATGGKGGKGGAAAALAEAAQEALEAREGSDRARLLAHMEACRARMAAYEQERKMAGQLAEARAKHAEAAQLRVRAGAAFEAAVTRCKKAGGLAQGAAADLRGLLRGGAPPGLAPLPPNVRDSTALGAAGSSLLERLDSAVAAAEASVGDLHEVAGPSLREAQMAGDEALAVYRGVADAQARELTDLRATLGELERLAGRAGATA